MMEQQQQQQLRLQQQPQIPPGPIRNTDDNFDAVEGEIKDDDDYDEHPNHEAFRLWLQSELRQAPGYNRYEATYEAAIAAIVQWRQRYAGNPTVWKRLFTKDRVLKEVIECIPILQAVHTYVAQYTVTTTDPKITILDLCSGKGYLSMLLSEMLPPDKVSKCILIDKAWPTCHATPKPHHMNWDHIYGNITTTTTTTTANNNNTTNTTIEEGNEHKEEEQDKAAGTGTYFTTWPIPLHTSKQNLKKNATIQQMQTHIFERIRQESNSNCTEDDAAAPPVIVLAVHVCGTLAIKAVNLFNTNGAPQQQGSTDNTTNNVHLFCLKPCCLPGMAYTYAAKGHTNTTTTFTIGRHTFPTQDVCSNGTFGKQGRWQGPPRANLRPKFQRWSHHLYRGIDLERESPDRDDNDEPAPQHSPSSLSSEDPRRRRSGRKKMFEFQVQVRNIKSALKTLTIFCIVSVGSRFDVLLFCFSSNTLSYYSILSACLKIPAFRNLSKVNGGYQNTYLLAERDPITRKLWQEESQDV